MTIQAVPAGDFVGMRVLCTGGSGFIGSELQRQLLADGADVLNVDLAAPKDERHKQYWLYCDIMDRDGLLDAFMSFRPTHVVHLAASTDTSQTSLDAFSTNTVGTENVVFAGERTPDLARLVVASTQHVRKPGSPPATSDQDYDPYGAYGESKVITEQVTRRANLSCGWTIVRPTTVWGPGHTGLTTGLWHLIDRGIYFHPSRSPVVRSFGYVSNVSWQVIGILKAPRMAVDRKVFYVGERCVSQIEWVNEFAGALRGKKVREIPQQVLRLAALIGDGLILAGIRAPIHTARFLNMITDNKVPLEPIYDLLGEPPTALPEAVRETVAWMRNRH